jgi:hypothetical protein
MLCFTEFSRGSELRDITVGDVSVCKCLLESLTVYKSILGASNSPTSSNITEDFNLGLVELFEKPIFHFPLDTGRIHALYHCG